MRRCSNFDVLFNHTKSAQKKIRARVIRSPKLEKQQSQVIDDLPRVINYLHHGESLAFLRVVEKYSYRHRINKSELLSLLRDSAASASFAREIIRRYGGSGRVTLDAPSLIADLDLSVSTRPMFRSLGCRGFSYEFVTDLAGFPVQLRSAINIRVGIFADTRFHYPPSVLQFLKNDRTSHYYHYHGPVLGFLLGILSGSNLYIVTLQSDPTCNTPSAIREHFRGWRRVLLRLALRRYQPERCYLVRSKDVLRACHDAYNVPISIPKSWLNIYEQSANEAGGKTKTLDRGINIQLYPRHAKVIAKKFYILK